MGSEPDPCPLAANTYDENVNKGKDYNQHITFGDFKKMVRPSIEKDASGADVDAILKRACFILNTKKFVCYRPSEVNEDKVARHFVESPDFLTQTGKMLYGRYKDNRKTFAVRKEQAWLELVFKQKQEKQDPKHKHNQQLNQLSFVGVRKTSPASSSWRQRLKSRERSRMRP